MPSVRELNAARLTVDLIRQTRHSRLVFLDFTLWDDYLFEGRAADECGAEFLGTWAEKCHGL